MTRSGQRANGNSMRIFLADGHTLFRAGLMRLLAKSKVGAVIGEAADGLEAIRKIAVSRPDILVLDLALPKLDGLEVLRRVRTRKDMRTLILTAEIQEKEKLEALQLGVSGIILKQSPFNDLIRCLQRVRAGGTWIGHGRGPVNISLLGDSSDRKGTPLPFHISHREMEIIKAVAVIRTTKGIARQLSISVQTVKHHLTNIFNKTGTSTRLELIIFAIEKGLLGRSELEASSNEPLATRKPA
jgi:two-component system nitrate/nitrite response regulator NarL